AVGGGPRGEPDAVGEPEGPERGPPNAQVEISGRQPIRARLEREARDRLLAARDGGPIWIGLGQLGHDCPQGSLVAHFALRRILAPPALTPAARALMPGLEDLEDQLFRPEFSLSGA